MSQPKYLFYATLLDAFQNYLSSSDIYHEYWGFSEDPEVTEEEFEAQQKQSLLDRINRLPFESEAADRGTAFNEIVDCINEKKVSNKMAISHKKEQRTLTAFYKEKEFVFPEDLCREFSNYFKGSVSQVYTEGILPTRYGDVLLYGFIDKLMPNSVNDIKMTGKYKAGKFRNNWQHIVYPYTLNLNGNNVSDFEYNIAVLSKYNYSTYTEHYAYVPKRDIPKLTTHVEEFIEFLESHRDIITDKKIFNLNN